MDKQLTPEEQDGFFREIIQKLPTVHSPAKLEELALLGIAMTLRRAASKDLRDELSRQVRDIVASVKSGECPDALRNAAHDCVKVLEMARDRRLPRSGPVTGNSFSGMPASHPSSHVQSKQAARGNHLTAFVAAVAAVLVIVGGAVWWEAGNNRSIYDDSATSQFLDQIVLAAQGEAPATHMFGGALGVTRNGGIPVVTAQGVPPQVCAAVGMRLVKKGLLGINGMTPSRISSAYVTELCNKEEGGATIMWAPTK